MKDIIFLVYNSERVNKMTKKAPYLEKGENFVRINFNVNDSIFKQPIFVADLHVEQDKEYDIEIRSIEKKIADLRKQKIQ